MQRWGAFIQPLLKSNKYYTNWVCVCSLRYTECSAHAPYCHQWPGRLYNISPPYLINRTIFEKKKLLNKNTCFDFLYKFYFSETFLILWRIEHDIIKNVQCSSCKVPVILVRFSWKLYFLEWFSLQLSFSETFLILWRIEHDMIKNV